MRAVYLLLTLLPCALLAQQPLTPFERDKAAAIIRDQLPCLGCHELNGTGGRSGPSLTTVGQRRDADYVRAMIENPQGIVSGTAMPKIPMSPSVRELIVRYVARTAPPGAPSTHPAAHHSSSPPAENLTKATPVQNYQKFCSTCHGRDGKGDGPNAQYLPVPPAVHASAASMSKRSDDALFDAISGGGVVMGKSARMPAFGQTLSRTEIRGLVAYIRQLCSCAGPAWSRDGKQGNKKQ